MSRTGLPPAASTRLVTSLAAGVVVGALLGLWQGVTVGVLGGLVVIHLVNVLWGWRDLWRMDAEGTRRNARREDFKPVLVEVLGVVISLGALMAIALVVVTGSEPAKAGTAVLALAGVVLSWFSLHLVYTGHYAYLYYDGRKGRAARDEPGGIDWNDEGHEATYRDFLYFAYNLGMTYQVSDTAVSSTAIRSVVLRQCLLSYFFGATILGVVINIVAGMVSGG